VGTAPSIKRLLLTCLFFLGLCIGPVAAHGTLVRAIPADRSVLQRAPTRLQYWFSEQLEPRFSQINLRDATGHILASSGVDPANPAALMLQIPPGTLSDGAYVVELRTTFASDSHTVAESRVFFVGTAASDLAGVGASTAAQPLEVVWKTLLLSSTSLLFGLYVTYSLVLLPVWGSGQYALGHLPPRLMVRLHHLIVIGIGLVLAANVFAIIQQAMTFFNVDAVTVIRTGLWDIVRTSSRAGDMWNLRMLLLVMLASLHGITWIYRDKWPELIRPTWIGNVWLVALIIGLQSVTSHAAGTLVQPWIAIAMQWTHSLAAAFWVGGIGVLALILPTALQPYTDKERQQALVALLRGFSRIVVGVVALIIMSGIYNALTWISTPQDVSTTYGSALLLKLLMVALLLGFGAAHHLAVNPTRRAQIAAWMQRVMPRTWATVTTLRWESLVGVVVLASAALLSATPIPPPLFLQTPPDPLIGTQSVSGLTTTLSVAPGVPGINTFDIVVERDGQALTDAQVELQLVQPARDQRTAWNTAEQVEKGLYVWTSDAIQTVGEWDFLIDVTEANSTRTRIAFTWSITPDETLIRPLSPLQAAVLLSVIGIAGWIVWPRARALAAHLNWHPASLLVAGSAIVLTVIIGIVGTRFIEDQQRRTDEMLNPLPQIVNPTLADAASLQRGEALYNQSCIIWQTASDLQILLRQLDSVRDEDLYRIPARGWRNMPACTAALTEAQTWDVVNYLRTRRVIAIRAGK